MNLLMKHLFGNKTRASLVNFDIHKDVRSMKLGGIEYSMVYSTVG